MEYNTQRKKIKIMDYGRNIEGLIQYVKTIEDREARNKAAESVVELMGLVAPKVKENTAWKRKMWDHMMILSNWELDVDWPVWAGLKPETPPENAMEFKPRRLTYSDRRQVRFRHYGKALEQMIAKARGMEEGPEKEELVKQIVERMKLCYSTWNQTMQDDAVVEKQLEILSSGQLRVGNKGKEGERE
jgi:hypothetical protein